MRAVETGILSSGNKRTFLVATTAWRTRWSYRLRDVVCMLLTQPLRRGALPKFFNDLEGVALAHYKIPEVMTHSTVSLYEGGSRFASPPVEISPQKS